MQMKLSGAFSRDIQNSDFFSIKLNKQWSVVFKWEDGNGPVRAAFNNNCIILICFFTFDIYCFENNL
jgi:hypothetical protein